MKYILENNIHYKYEHLFLRMRNDLSTKVVFFFSNLFLSSLLAGLGIFVFSENKAISIITILIAFTLIFFTFYTFQIHKNQIDLEEVKNKLKLIERKIDIDWKVLNSMLDNKLIEKINELLNKENE